MKRPEPFWETDYQHDRRKHSHRCRICNRIINSGERVFMCRVAKGTFAAHVEHDTQELRDKLTAWGLQGLKRQGWRVPELDTHY